MKKLILALCLVVACYFSVPHKAISTTIDVPTWIDKLDCRELKELDNETGRLYILGVMRQSHVKTSIATKFWQDAKNSAFLLHLNLQKARLEKCRDA